MFGSSDVFWIVGTPPPGLAIVLCPRGGDWLEDELMRMKRDGVQVLVSLLEIDEAEELGLSEEAEMAAQTGLQYLSYPIPDRHTPPDRKEFRRFAEKLAERLHVGQRIGIHCRGSIGRATITAACALIHFGWKPEAALDAIEEARGCAVPDTEEQRRWIIEYEAQP